MEFVELWNKNSDPRISTYVILGEGGSRCCIVRRYLCVSPLDGATSTSSIIELIPLDMLYHNITSIYVSHTCQTDLIHRRVKYDPVSCNMSTKGQTRHLT